jgi:glucan phosphoethanolaminetransferase (alkaline phosphatase superfamily)
LWVYNQKKIEEWTKIKTFKDDLRFLTDAYDGRIGMLDDDISSFLKLWNNSELKKNTIIIFTGDHGQSFVDHYSLHAAGTTYDSQIKVPLIIKFPGMNKSFHINRQFSLASIKKIIEAVMVGKLNDKMFMSFIENNFEDNDLIFSTNCIGSATSVRYKNQFKLINWSDRNEKELFNLLDDPLELTNIYNQKNKMTGFLEEKLFLHSFKEDLDGQEDQERCNLSKI